VKPWVQYSLLRIAIFAIVLVVLLLLGVQPILSAVVAAVIGLCVSYIFFGTLRNAVAADLAARRANVAPPRDVDAEAEDVED
jgi:uncharacterized membrane protein YphA (DoxX/SURF4 family)